MHSRTQRHSVWHGLAVLLVATFVLAPAAALQAQVLSDPRIAEFDPSPDHSRVLDSGQPAVLRYDLGIYLVGAAAPFTTVDMGKPSPDADGRIRYDFASKVTGWPLPGGNYEARVSAVGPDGVALSDASNPFTFTTGASCTVSLSATTANVPSSGGSYAASVSAGAGCQWTATTPLAWVTLWTAGGSGSGTVPFEVAANSSSSIRTGAITIGGQKLTLSQAGAAPSCSYGLSPSSASVPAAGGSASFAVTAGTGCSWTAAASASWITVSGGSGSGGGTVSLSVAANASTATRSGTIVVQGQTFTITQAGAASACSYNVSPTYFSIPYAGGSGQVSVVTDPGCAWTVATSQSWLAPSVTSGTGSATIPFVARPNSGKTARTAKLTVGPWNVQVFQSGRLRQTK
jgi:hypothetical protein